MGILPSPIPVSEGGTVLRECCLFDVAISTQAMHVFYSYDRQSGCTTVDTWPVSYLRFHANSLLGSTGVYHSKRDGAQVKRGRVLIFDERELQAQLCGRCRGCV